jgi:murein DD-endopeptidase / murein LD-carboxypeptidase
LVLSRTARSQYEECDKIKKNDLREGDLVFFRTRRGVSHVGVYLGNGYFTHASTSNGVMISRLDEDYYRKKYIGGGRVILKNNTAE